VRAVLIGLVLAGLILAAAAARAALMGGQGFGTTSETLAGPCRRVATSRTTYVVRVCRAGTANAAKPLASSLV
jgi:hypothetical protein